MNGNNISNQGGNVSIEAVLDELGFILHPIKGISMLPMLDQHRDNVYIVAVKGDERGKLKKHDIPLYRRPNGQYVLHRILAVKKDHYIIRGDNLVTLEYIPFDWILGKTENYYKDGKECDLQNSEYLAYVKKITRFWRIKSLYYRIRGFGGRILRRILKNKK